jgi:indolepyruvate ferredoxin oxidoreductase, alpha subunit
MTIQTEQKRIDPLLAEDAGHTELLLGNEAIVRGALEAGVGFACGYPGTPSSEITDSFARVAAFRGIHFEYSVNEKIALEMAFAASLAGARSIVAMKHLGLMAAGDPLATIPYVGAVAGMVIVSAGDPSCLTSPNEQDQRYLASMLHIPMLDPSTAQEALEMTRFAFELSERAELPVILRPMTRLCHTRAEVEYGLLREPEFRGFGRDPNRFVPIPANARRLRVRIDDRIRTARELLVESGFLRSQGSGRTMIVASGVPRQTCHDVLCSQGLDRDVKLLHLGATFPVADEWLLRELRQVDRVLVVEELLPFVEDSLRALCSRHRLDVEILGKGTGHLPDRFEYEPAVIQKGIHDALGLGDSPAELAAAVPVPIRPPVLCSACPHRAAFFAARAAFGEDALYFNDIGCYTLGFGAPLEAADALLCMGAGFTLAAGVSRATGERTVGFMGDSTFFHSGMPALLNAVKSEANMVAVIMDNEVTAMTGFQESPTVEVEGGRPERRVDIEGIVRALGCEHVETVDPDDLAATTQAFRRAKERSGLATIITKRPCPVFFRRVSDGEAPARAVDESPAETWSPTYTIDHARCQNCGREACGQRCDQLPTERFQRAMARARSLEVGDAKKDILETAPCATKCPLNLCIQGYAAHIAGGQYAAALELIMHQLPLPDSVCRVCHEPCETVCVRGALDEPVAINGLKRFVLDWAAAQENYPYHPELEVGHDRHVAVVGAGPAGLAAAHELRLRGYDVTVFDAAAEPGGLLREGVPRYRLPLEVLRRDVERIRAIGVRFEQRRRLGDDLDLESLLERHDAVCLAIGAGQSRRIDLAGEGARVDDALTYLRANRTDCGVTARQVVVVGGGNAAVDSARTALRCGAESVVIACLENRTEMPAIRAEIREAECEGVVIEQRVRVLRLCAEGVVGARVEPRVPGDTSPENFEVVQGPELVFAADQVILAIGQDVDRERLRADASALEWTDGHVAIDPDTGATGRPRVFAAGDLVGGAQTVTDAIAQGLRAAWGIDVDMRGHAMADQRLPPPRVSESPVAARPGVRRQQYTGRQRPRELDSAHCTANFEEVSGVLTEAQARAEAERCMICGQCGNCRSCVDLFGCPAIFVDPDMRVQIDAGLCVGCGVCAQFCPNGAIHPAAEVCDA